jgi:hypothetical protein
LAPIAARIIPKLAPERSRLVTAMLGHNEGDVVVLLVRAEALNLLDNTSKG